MSSDKKNLLLLFDKPQEPVFVPKGPNKATFNVPQSYLDDKYKPIRVQLFNRFGEESGKQIPVDEIMLPSLGDIVDVGRHENFSLFIPKHSRLAGKLIDLFMGMKNTNELLSMGCYARDRVNPYLFNYAFSVALLHRPDTQDLDVPSFMQSFPDKFMDSQVFVRAREENAIVPETSRRPIEFPKDFSASDLEPEHRVAYWREDLGINLHHWHWHLVYPFAGAREIVDKNRRGELFYYMHQQIIARYNIERLCNQMRRVVRWSEWKQPIEEAYFSKLNSLVASRSYPDRVSNLRISNLSRDVDQIHQDVDDLIRWRDRIYDAIHSGFITDETGNRIVLTENEGIDVLGNIVEASDISPNRNFYGNLHNMGHLFLAYIHDPDHRHLETFGVMGDSATTMRDPIFYRWHGYIDDLFQEFKATLPTYSVARLNYPGVTVNKVAITSKGSQPNVLNTFWQQSDIDLSRGLDFSERNGTVFGRFTHLNHQPFTYNITVNNQGEARQGTCRIFLAPKLDERGNPWLFRDQRLMFIEMDKFTVNLRPGENTISRQSTESSVTIPFERTFRNLNDGRPTGGDALAQFNFCGCGWPQHMLLPKGTSEGYQMQCFVMISNYADDVVNQSLEGACSDAASFCGIKDKLYPDRRSMGYPFDRMGRPGVNILRDFLTQNMLVQDCVVKFANRTIRPRNNQ